MLWNLKQQIPLHLFNPCAPELCKPYSLLISACFAPGSTVRDLFFILDRLHHQWNTKSQRTFKMVAEGATSQLVTSPNPDFDLLFSHAEMCFQLSEAGCRRHFVKTVDKLLENKK